MENFANVPNGSSLIIWWKHWSDSYCLKHFWETSRINCSQVFHMEMVLYRSRLLTHCNWNNSGKRPESSAHRYFIWKWCDKWIDCWHTVIGITIKNCIYIDKKQTVYRFELIPKHLLRAACLFYIFLCVYLFKDISLNTEVYSGPCETYMMKIFVKIVSR